MENLSAMPALEIARNLGPGSDTGPARLLHVGPYRLRFATCREDLDAVFRLRFLVFNLELGEGLESAYANGLDTDEFDSVCDHIAVEHIPTGRIVGTYRLQTGRVAARNLGFYSAREFDFTPYEPIRDSLVELGRASIHREHRSFEVLTLLWRGVAGYAKERSARYLIGCCSLATQDPAEGHATHRQLQTFLADPHLTTLPRPGFCLPSESSQGHNNGSGRPPRLLRAYLSIGAKICGPPAIDRDFKTIDFLTLLDLEGISGAARARFLE